MRYEVTDKNGKVVWSGDAADLNHALGRAYYAMPVDLPDLMRAVGYTSREVRRAVTVDAEDLRTALLPNDLSDARAHARNRLRAALDALDREEGQP
jgi:hypothetical protein